MKIFILSFLLLLSGVVYSSTVDTVSIPSPSMHKSIRCVIITPEGYASTTRRYPVVYLLHGHAGYYSDWIKLAPEIKSAADTYNQILVCPDGGYNSWYVNSVLDSNRRYETHISKEVVTYIDNHYRTLADRNHRAITGLSMGGHGAFYLALRHPEVFGAVGSTSGGVDITPFKRKWQIAQQIGDTVRFAANWRNMTIINLIEKYPANSLSIIFDCGTEDFFYEVNKKLHQKMLLLKIKHDFIDRPGDHTWEYWRAAIPYHFLFFDQCFRKEGTKN